MTNYEKISEEFTNKLEDYGKELVQEQLDQCTKGQVKLFKQMFKKVSKISLGKLPMAYVMCRSLVLKNEEKELGSSED